MSFYNWLQITCFAAGIVLLLAAIVGPAHKLGPRLGLLWMGGLFLFLGLAK